MATKMNRVVIFLPDDVYEKLLAASEQRRESMSNIGRRLIMEWLKENPPEIQDGPPPAIP